MEKQHLQPFQQRLLDERDRLQSKLKALTRFINEEGNYGTKYSSLGDDERTDMLRQRIAMGEYLMCLNRRIDRFIKPEQEPEQANEANEQ